MRWLCLAAKARERVHARWLLASARWPCVVALALGPLLAAGCGGVATSPAADSVGKQLTIYSSLPLQGPSAAISQQIIAGEKLALADAGGHVGRLQVSYVSLDDSGRTTGEWDPGVTAANARAAAQDPTTIAYLGDYNSGATAISLPLINAAGILQVSPASPYVGLTSSQDAGEDEPERFYPTALRTFGRVAPGDPVQAGAQVALLRRLGIRRLYVIADEDPFDQPLTQILAGDARRAGIAVLGQDSLDTSTATVSFAGEAAKVAATQAQAVFVSAVPTLGVAKLFRQLHAAGRGWFLLGSSSLSDPLFTSRLGVAEGSVYLGTPAFPLSVYSSSAQRIAGEYRVQFGGRAGAYVLYGYEAMSVVLAAIRAAGKHGDERKAVIHSFFATRARRSVLGDYSILASGETTLSRYGIARVSHGTVEFWRML